MYYLVRTVWLLLVNRYGNRFFITFEWVKKTEYQGRKTPHWHIAAWVVARGPLSYLAGRTQGQKGALAEITSAFIRTVLSPAEGNLTFSRVPWRVCAVGAHGSLYGFGF